MASDAKAAVAEFMAKAGHHDTTVHERVAPAVLHETINKTQHEEVLTAIDKEVHQDHYHTSVQPVTDRQILPEQHTHNLVAVEHRSFDHGNAAEVEARLAREAAQFKDERVIGSTTHTHSVAPVIAGEHIHHHVHETIQPVVQRETIQPTVIHTTVPIHEVHHNAAQVHSTSALPAVSMADFKKQGGVLTGREERFDGFEGEPRSVGGALGAGGVGSETVTSSSTTGHHHGHHEHGHHSSSTTGTTGLTGSSSTYDNDTSRSGYGSTGLTGSSSHNTSSSTRKEEAKEVAAEAKQGKEQGGVKGMINSVKNAL